MEARQGRRRGEGKTGQGRGPDRGREGGEGRGRGLPSVSQCQICHYTTGFVPTLLQ